MSTRDWIVPAAIAGVISFAAGAIVGYSYARREIEVSEVIDDETVVDFQELKDEWEVIQQEKKEEAKANHPSTQHKAGDILIDDNGLEYQYIPPQRPDPPLPEPEVVITINPVDDSYIQHNVFNETSSDGWDFEAELQQREANPNKPYVIHYHEFGEDHAYEQITVTYYVGDDILADDDDVPIYNYTATVGELKWGHGTTDVDVFYARNEKLRAEYEVLRNPGSFAEVILGLEFGEKPPKQRRKPIKPPKRRKNSDDDD